MNVLMISLARVIGEPAGDVVERHVAYAKACGGQIHMVTFCSKSKRQRDTVYEDRFFAYSLQSVTRWTFPFDAYRKAAQVIRSNKIDLIYTQDPFATGIVGCYLKQRFNIPLVIGNHSNFIDNSRWINEAPVFFGMLNQLGKWLLPRADAWRVINQWEKDVYVQTLGLPNRRIGVLPTPTNIERFLRPVSYRDIETLRFELQIPKESPVLLWVGRPVPLKRIPILYAVFKRVQMHYPQAILLLVGNRDLAQENLENFAQHSNIATNIRWSDGEVTHEQLPAYYQLADSYIHTSCYEGFGKVMVEAQASGLPVVTTATAGGTEIVVDGETGFIAPLDDVDTLADRVLTLLADPERVAAMGRAARQRAITRYDRSHAIGNIVAFWRKVVENYEAALV